MILSSNIQKKCSSTIALLKQSKEKLELLILIRNGQMKLSEVLGEVSHKYDPLPWESSVVCFHQPFLHQESMHFEGLCGQSSPFPAVP